MMAKATAQCAVLYRRRAGTEAEKLVFECALLEEEEEEEEDV